MFFYSEYWTLNFQPFSQHTHTRTHAHTHTLAHIYAYTHTQTCIQTKHLHRLQKSLEKYKGGLVIGPG